MKQLFALFLGIAAAGLAHAQTDSVSVADGLEPMPAAEVNLSDFLWTHRPIVVFADTDADPRFRQQLDLIERRFEALLERDVVLIIDADPSAGTDIRNKLRPRGFQLTLIGKDGGIKLRKPFPWDVRELSRVIDKMPLRQQEIRAQKEAN